MTDKKLTERVYGYLAEDEDARVCKDIPESACNEQPRSFVLMLLSLMLTKLGDSLVSARLVLPWMLSSLGAPAIFISALYYLSFLLLKSFVNNRYANGSGLPVVSVRHCPCWPCCLQ